MKPPVLLCAVGTPKPRKETQTKGALLRARRTRQRTPNPYLETMSKQHVSRLAGLSQENRSANSREKKPPLCRARCRQSEVYTRARNGTTPFGRAMLKTRALLRRDAVKQSALQRLAGQCRARGDGRSQHRYHAAHAGAHTLVSELTSKALRLAAVAAASPAIATKSANP